MGRHSAPPDEPRRRPHVPAPAPAEPPAPSAVPPVSGPRPAPSHGLVPRAVLALAVGLTTALVLAWGGVSWTPAVLLGLAAAVVVGVGTVLAASLPAPPRGERPGRRDDEPVQ